MTTEQQPRHWVRGAQGHRIATYPHPLNELAAPRPPVLLVHAMGSDAATNWQRAGWLRALHQAGRTAVSLDLRGHGASDSPVEPAGYRLLEMAGDVRAVLADHTTGPVDAIGYSLGARLLLELGAREPTLFRRLALGGSAGQPILQRIDVDQVGRAVNGGSPPGDAESTRIAKVVTALPSNNPHALFALVRGLNSDPDAQRRAPDSVQPTLVAVGTDDQLHDQARDWAAALLQAEFVSLTGRNHMSAVPSGVFRAAAIAFLDR